MPTIDSTLKKTMNNIFLVLCVIMPLSAASPTVRDAEAKLLSYTNENDGLGNYEFRWV